MFDTETPGHAGWAGRLRPEQGPPPAPVREMQESGVLLQKNNINKDNQKQLFRPVKTNKM